MCFAWYFFPGCPRGLGGPLPLWQRRPPPLLRIWRGLFRRRGHHRASNVHANAAGLLCGRGEHTGAGECGNKNGFHLFCCSIFVWFYIHISSIMYGFLWNSWDNTCNLFEIPLLWTFFFWVILKLFWNIWLGNTKWRSEKRVALTFALVLLPFQSAILLDRFSCWAVHSLVNNNY